MFIAVPNDYSPCELHEVWPCAICNGDAARYDAELVRDQPDVDARRPRLGGGWVEAGFPGHCATCGRGYEVGTPIRFSPGMQGWKSKECCG